MKALIGIDGSEPSIRATYYASKHVLKPGAWDIILLHVIDTRVFTRIEKDGICIARVHDTCIGIDDTIYPKLCSNARRMLDLIADNLKALGYNVEILCRKGNPSEEILKVADEYDVDLIVLGRVGKTGIHPLGSIAHHVLLGATRPVFIVPRT